MNVIFWVIWKFLLVGECVLNYIQHRRIVLFPEGCCVKHFRALVHKIRFPGLGFGISVSSNWVDVPLLLHPLQVFPNQVQEPVSQSKHVNFVGCVKLPCRYHVLEQIHPKLYTVTTKLTPKRLNPLISCALAVNKTNRRRVQKASTLE